MVEQMLGNMGHPQEKNLDFCIQELESIMGNEEMMRKLFAASRQLDEVGWPEPALSTAKNLVGSKSFNNLLELVDHFNDVLHELTKLADEHADIINKEKIESIHHETLKKLENLTELTDKNKDALENEKWSIIDESSNVLLSHVFESAEAILQTVKVESNTD